MSSGNIPQFSSFYNGNVHLTKILHECGNFGPDFVVLGKYLTGNGKKLGAYRKYGENHAKLGELLGLCFIDTTPRPNKVFLTNLGKIFVHLEDARQKEFVAKISVQIPIVNLVLKKAIRGIVNLRDEMTVYLSKSTLDRRLPNVMCILSNLRYYSNDVEVVQMLRNIVR